jgi:hypothetical protein
VLTVALSGSYTRGDQLPDIRLPAILLPVESMRVISLTLPAAMAE